jgi:zinc protease
VQQVFDTVLTAPLLPNPVVATAKSGGGLLRTQPKSGTIVRETRHAKSDIFEWTLSNGARVLFKSTPFNPDELIIHAHSFGGSSLLPDSLAFSPGRMVDGLMSATPGLGDLGNEQLVKQLSTTIIREFKVSLNYGDEQVALAGSPKELETLFQMMYLQFTAPRIDTNALKHWKKYGQQSLGRSMDDSIASVLSRGNPRFAPRSPDLIQMVDVEQALAVYRDRFGDAGDFTFTIVGAADPTTVRQFVERYIASLPSLGKREREKPLESKVRPWAGIDRKRVPHPQLHSKRAVTAFIFDGRLADMPEQYLIERPQLSTVGSVLSRRLREDLRERMSLTYGVSVVPQVYRNPELHYRFSVQMDAAPEKIDTASMVILRNIDSLRMYGASSVDLEKDQAVQNRILENRLHENKFWVTMIQSYDHMGIPLDRIGEPITRPMTSAEFQEAVRKYLPKDSFIGRTYVPVKEN